MVDDNETNAVFKEKTVEDHHFKYGDEKIVNDENTLAKGENFVNGVKTPSNIDTPKQSFKVDEDNSFKREVSKEPAVLDIREMSVKPESSTREVLEDRDPNNLNQHVQIVWDDIIGEPEGARSPECAWRLSNLCFQHSRNWCYTVMAVLVAPPCALIMGCCFACLAFEQIWCMAPCLRCVKIYFATLRTLVMACMATFLVPVADAFGHCCRNIRVNMRKEAPDEKDFLIV